jgi:hypothetical protein
LAHYPYRGDELVTFHQDSDIVVRRGNSLAPYHIPGQFEGFDAPGTGFGDPLGWLPDFGLLWYGGDGYVLDGNGERLFRLGAGITHDLAPLRLAVMRDDGLAIQARIRGTNTSLPSPDFVAFDDGIAIVTWRAGDDLYTSVVDLGDGEVFDRRSGGLVPIGTASGPRFVVGICDGVLVACDADSAWGFNRPAIYSLLDGRLNEIAGIDESRRVVGSQRGPFARVLPADDCVPIHKELDIDTSTIACVPPGEPLTLYDLQPIEGYYPGEPTTIRLDGAEHVQVLTPFGEPGWIRVDAVEIGQIPEP